MTRQDYPKGPLGSEGMSLLVGASRFEVSFLFSYGLIYRVSTIAANGRYEYEVYVALIQ